ncbi:MAG: aminoglycoside phosphotransferase family protein [Candidatus Izemoplasmatales bacterium]
MRKLIGEGWQAKVFLDEDGRVYKVYPDDFSIERVILEKQIMTLVSQKTNVPIPTLYEHDHPREIAMSFGGYVTYGENMKRREEGVMERFVSLQQQIHQWQVPELPDIALRLRTKYRQSGKFTEEELRKLEEILDSMKTQENLIHMDFHPDNILMNENQPTIIDWVMAGKGNPTLDFANTYTILSMFAKRRAQKYLSLLEKQHLATRTEVLRAVPLFLAQMAVWESEYNHLVNLKQEIAKAIEGGKS